MPRNENVPSTMNYQYMKEFKKKNYESVIKDMSESHSESKRSIIILPWFDMKSEFLDTDN